MSYEIKDVLYWMLDNNKPHWKKETMRKAYEELDEVYRKAKAFDDIAYDYANNTGLGEHDEDLTDFEAIVDSIEYAIQEVESSENEEESR